VNVLFVCIQNAGRSQIAGALFDRAAAGARAARSAGSNPAELVHPEVVEVMRELDMSVSERVPRKLGRADAEWADVVVKMGCGDACPGFVRRFSCGMCMGWMEPGGRFTPSRHKRC
jgi:arsenate reductase